MPKRACSSIPKRASSCRLCWSNLCHVTIMAMVEVVVVIGFRFASDK